MAREQLCKYCKIQMLEGFDEVERKFYEKGSRTLHTRERCEAIRGSGKAAGPSNSNIDLSEIMTKLSTIETKIDQLYQILKGQSTFNGNE